MSALLHLLQPPVIHPAGGRYVKGIGLGAAQQKIDRKADRALVLAMLTAPRSSPELVKATGICRDRVQRVLGTLKKSGVLAYSAVDFRWRRAEWPQPVPAWGPTGMRRKP